MSSAWLKLFQTQLSKRDGYWLRWRGDFAESAELRRAYSGLYGRFFARALLSHHLGLSRFVPLNRGGIDIPGSASVRRIAKGDIPDWLAWDDQNSQFVLCEAKGSLCATDFLSADGPKCVGAGKAQFERVKTFDGQNELHPRKWVAATRWATEHRSGYPVTVLWDPPVDETPMAPTEAARHRKAIGIAWLNSVAPGLGWDLGEDLISPERELEGVTIRATPGPIASHLAWPEHEFEVDIYSEDSIFPFFQENELARPEGIRPRLTAMDNLTETNIYSDRSLLSPRPTEKHAHEGHYLISLITRFGIRPIRSTNDWDLLRRAKDQALELKEPAIIAGLPLGLDPTLPRTDTAWMDESGIAKKNDLSVFDLRAVEVERLASST